MEDASSADTRVDGRSSDFVFEAWREEGFGHGVEFAEDAGEEMVHFERGRGKVDGGDLAVVVRGEGQGGEVYGSLVLALRDHEGLHHADVYLSFGEAVGVDGGGDQEL